MIIPKNSSREDLKNSIGKTLSAYHKKYHKALSDRVDSIITSTDGSIEEVYDARVDSTGRVHPTLSKRIASEVNLSKEHLQEVEGTHITQTNTYYGDLLNVSLSGNTTQDSTNLEIKSTGIDNGDGTYSYKIRTHNQNLLRVDKHNLPELVSYDEETQIFTLNGHGYDHAKIFDGPMFDCKVGDEITITVEYISGTMTGTGPLYIGGYYQDNSIVRWAGYVELRTTTQPGVYKSKTVLTEPGMSFFTFWTNVGADYSNYKVRVKIEKNTETLDTEMLSESSELEINLPFQLESVGNVKDELYYDESKKLWCVKKHIKTENITQESTVVYYEQYNSDTHYYFRVRLKSGLFATPENGVLCNKLLVKTHELVRGNEEGIRGIGKENAFEFTIEKSKIGDVVDKTIIKSFLEKEGYMFKYILHTPEEYVLPLDVQNNLKSFDKVTHIISEAGDISPRLSCKLAKSFGASMSTLQSNVDSVSSRLARVESMERSNKVTYSTDSLEKYEGSFTCKNTVYGELEISKISGRTVVNLLSRTQIPIGDETFVLEERLNPNKVYTVQVFGSYKGKLNFMGWSNGTHIANKYVDVDGDIISVIDLTYNNVVGDITDIRIRKEAIISDADIKILVTEGDTSNIINPYVETMKSVESSDVLALKVKDSGGNLMLPEYFDYYRQGKNISNTQDGYYGISIDLPHEEVLVSVKKVNNASVQHSYLSNELGNLVWLTYNDESMETPLTRMKVKKGKLFFRLAGVSGLENINNAFQSLRDSFDIQIIPVDVVREEFIPSSQDKYLYYNDRGLLRPIKELRSVHNIKDTIEQYSDGNWYYHKRCGYRYLTGAEDWYVDTQGSGEDDGSNPYGVALVLENGISCPNFDTNYEYFINTKIVNKQTYGINGHSMNYGCGNKLFIKFKENQLPVDSLEEAKLWLSRNNIEVVYVLAKELVYPVESLILDSYEDYTTISFESEVKPDLIFNISNHLNNKVRNHDIQIEILEKSNLELKLQVQNLNAEHVSGLVALIEESLNNSEEKLVELNTVLSTILSNESNRELKEQERQQSINTLVSDITVTEQDIADIMSMVGGI